METITGKVRALNLSRQGFYESFLLDVGQKVFQINFGRDAGSDSAKPLHTGQTVTVKAKRIANGGPSDHPVYERVGDPGGTVEGVVQQINYAKHGEPNGAILKTGEFVHLRPNGAKALKLKLGQTLSVEGDSRKFPSGHVVVEARLVNGQSLRHPAEKSKKK